VEGGGRADEFEQKGVESIRILISIVKKEFEV